ncbi:MAG: sensor histidine kinase, partial [Alphaproteobacteria bacterium]
MSQYSHHEHINSWLEQVSKDLPSERLASLFGETLTNISKHSLVALNKITLMAIVKRVLYQSSEKHPVLSRLNVESTGISTDQFIDQFGQIDSSELSEAFHYFMDELLTVLGDLTADILPTSFENENKSSNLELKTSLDRRGDNLFEISKIFVGFENVEETFPEFLMILGNIFSFQTILLIEKKGEDCITSIWQNANVCEENLKRAFDYSRQSYEYLVGPLSHHEVETYESVTKHVLPLCNLKNDSDVETHKKFITMPLVLNSLQSFGVLQFESVNPLSEEDLRFLNSISNLLAITLDRFNKKEEFSRVKQNEISKRTGELDLANGYVRELENERVLREQFVSILTHDLRTPLTSAKMSAQLIIRYPDKLENNNILASRIVRNIDRMDQMIQDLLDVSRIRAGESLTFAMSSCDLRSITIDTLKELSIAHGDRFVLRSDRVPLVGFWNAEGIRRVLENLATNAVKYGASKEPITITIKS